MWQDAGFLTVEPDTKLAMKQLASFIETIPEKYRQLTKEELLKKSAPDKWCRQEILGHLIDSAINNLKRFTDIQFSPPPYIIQAYNQNNLVIVNDYINLPLEHLLNLWCLLNQQIIFIVDNIPSDTLRIPVNPQYDNKEIKTLEWIICDYVAHMEHHFKQVF